jgi:hypothetical protein
MRVLIYKRTHSGDPDPVTGLFGNFDCMGGVRTWNFDAVIGVGGRGAEAQRNNIDGKITWVGIGRHEQGSNGRGPLLGFDRFRYWGEEGPALAEYAPRLASRTFRVLMSDNLSQTELAEVDSILALARCSPPSSIARPGSRPAALRRLCTSHTQLPPRACR